jgi:hypothetical protein
VAERRFMVAGTITLAVGAAFVVAWRELSATPASDPRAILPLADAPPPRREPRRLPGPPDAPLGEPRAE